KECLASDKPKRQSYFSLRRHEAPRIVTAPATKTVTLALGDDSHTPEKQSLRRKLSRKLNGESDAGAKTLRRRSIPVISYLVSKRSEPKLSSTDSAAPEIGSQEDMPTRRQQQQQQQQNTSERRTSESSSGDESSGGESDDTLATQDCSGVLVEFGADPANDSGSSTAVDTTAEEQLSAAASLFPSSAMAAAGNGCGTGSLDHAPCGANGEGAADNTAQHRTAFGVHKDAETALPKPTQHRRRSLLLRIGIPATPSPIATATADTGSRDTPLKRRQLTLGRLGGGKVPQRSQDASQKTQWHKQLVQRKVASAVSSTLAGMHGSFEGSKECRLLEFPVRMLPGAGDSIRVEEPRHRLRIKAHSRTQQEMRKKRSGNGLGRLFHPPPLTETEQKRMDAWAADNDEFSTDEYDLTGVYFELPAIDMLAAEPRTATHKSTEGAKCSRLSSTSTVVDDGALSPELSKRLFVASARKLQWSGNGKRGMATLLHIRNAMARANEHYVVASGGRRLSGPSVARVMVAELYTRDDHCYESAALARAYSHSRYGELAAAALVSDCDLLGFGAGDLVSLDATSAGGHAGAADCGRYRRRANRRWLVPRSCRSGVAAAIPAGGAP
ncbi:hypothetical protein GGI22_005774, partial [Coemansia erecta]